MLNEIPGNPGGWKNRLDSLDAIPGEPWEGRSASWERLHARLHEKPRRKKMPWWWLAAAAVLLLFVAGALLLPKHTGNGLVKNKPLPVYAAPYMPAPAAPVQPTAPESLLIIKNNPVSTATRAVVSRPRRLPKMILPPAGIPADTLATLQARVAPPSADTPLLTRVAVQPKKKLPVVHINELDSRGQDGIQWTNSPSYSPKRFFRLLLINTETSSSAAAEKQSAGNNRFTIKTPIKN